MGMADLITAQHSRVNNHIDHSFIHSFTPTCLSATHLRLCLKVMGVTFFSGRAKKFMNRVKTYLNTMCKRVMNSGKGKPFPSQHFRTYLFVKVKETEIIYLGGTNTTTRQPSRTGPKAAI